jgi:hypothetical protein
MSAVARNNLKKYCKLHHRLHFVGTEDTSGAGQREVFKTTSPLLSKEFLVVRTIANDAEFISCYQFIPSFS